MKTIDRSELDQWAHQQHSFALLDVLPGAEEGEHLGERMPHEHNTADFLAQIDSLGDDKAQVVVLYESSTASIPSAAAAGLLEDAGFGNVYLLMGPQAALHTSGHASRSR